MPEPQGDDRAIDAALEELHRRGVTAMPSSAGRHTFGSWLVQARVDAFVVGKLMGHKDSKMVERYY